MSGQDLFEQLRERTEYLDRALKDMRQHGIRYGNAEHKYRQAMTVEMLRQRADGMPVTILRDVCLGLKEISDLRLERDIAEAEYKAAQEAINVYKLQIRLIGEQIDREYRG